MERNRKILLKSTVTYASIASLVVACFDQSTQRPLLMGNRDSKKIKSYANITNQNNKRLKKDEAQSLDVYIKTKQTKSVLADTYEASDNQKDIDLDLSQQMLDNVSSQTSRSDSIGSIKTALHSTDGLEKTAPIIKNNQEESMYMDIIPDKSNDDYYTDNDPIYEEIINTYPDINPDYETPRSNSNDRKHTGQKPTSISPAQSDKNESHIYQNTAYVDLYPDHIYEEIHLIKDLKNNNNEKPSDQNTAHVDLYPDHIYEEIHLIKDLKNNKNEKLSDQNRSPVSKKQVKNIRDIFKTVLKHIT